MRRWSKVLVGLWLLLWPGMSWGAYGEIQDDGLIYHLYHLNGDYSDATGNKDFFEENSPSPTEVQAYFSTGYDFAAGDTALKVQNTTTPPVNPDQWETGTILVWYYRDFLSTDSSTRREIWSIEGNFLAFQWETSLNWNLVFDGISANLDETFAPSYIDYHTWTQLVFTWDSTTDDYRFYTNGIKVFDVATSTGGLVLKSNYDLRIGNNFAKSTPGEGIYDEYVLLGTVLSDSQIKHIYAMQKGKYGVIN